MTEKETVTLLQTLVSFYPASRIRADELTVRLWQAALDDLPAEAVNAAVMRMVSLQPFPPTVADLRRAVAEAVQEARGAPSAGEAWAKVARAARRYGYYRPSEARGYLGEDIWQVVKQVGGWRAICGDEIPEGVISAQFERRYTEMRRRQAERIQVPESARAEMARIIGPLTETLRLDDGGGGDDQ